MGVLDLLLAIAIGLGVGVVGTLAIRALIGRRAAEAPVRIDEVQVIAERVRSVSRLVGLEVSAKEIATARKGVAWLPPILLSQARLAMIFQFEKQYAVDLTRISPGDVENLTGMRYRLTLPAVEGTLRLIDVSPYDIQDGRVLGLLDVIQMNASTQKALMERAQEQAARLFETSDARYRSEARASVERQLKSLLGLFDAEVEIAWKDMACDPPADPRAVGELSGAA